MKQLYRTTPRRSPAALPLLVLLLFLGGCPAMTPDRPGLPNLVWPPPPEIPRIALLNLVQGPEDLDIRRSLPRRLWSRLTGEETAAMQRPHGLTLDSAGRLYVVDKLLRRVQVFDRQGESYRQIPAGGKPLLSPIDVAVDERRGRIFVSDAEDGSVRVFGQDGQAMSEIKRGLLARPTGLAVNRQSDELLVIDSEHASLLRFSLEDLQPLGIIGHQGNSAGLFNAPTAVAAGPDGSIYVVDTLNHRIQIFSATGRFLRTFGAAGDAPGYFSRPKGVAIDAGGNIHVVDALFDNVQVFDGEGRLLMSYGSPGSEPGHFWLPSGIAGDGRGRMYVSDSYNRRIQVFQILDTGELPE